MTQNEMAEKIGVTDKAVSKWETGRSLPDASLWQPVCKLLGISVNELYFGELEEINGVMVGEANKMNKNTVSMDNKAIEGALVEIVGFHQTITKAKNMIIGVILIMGGALLGLTANTRDLYQLIRGSVANWDQFFVGLMSGIATALIFVGIVMFAYSYSLFLNRSK